MESPSFVQTLQNTDWRFKHATNLGEVLCLSTLIAVGELGKLSDVDSSTRMWVEKYGGHCPNCPYNNSCLASLIGE